MTVNTKEIVEQELSIVFAAYDEKEQKVTVLAQPKDDSPASLNIRFQAYNEDTREFYDDADAKKAGLEKLAKVGISLDEIKSMKCFGKTFSAYVMDGRVYFNKPQRFIKANQITNREAVQLDGLEVVTIPLADQKSKHRFRAMFEAPIKVKGKDEPEVLGFMVSQLIFDDPEDIDTPPRAVGLRYTTKEIADFEDQLANTEGLPEQVINSIKQFIEGATERARKDKVEELKTLFGFDIDEVIEKGQRFRVRLHKNQIPNNSVFYLSADLLEVLDADQE